MPQTACFPYAPLWWQVHRTTTDDAQGKRLRMRDFGSPDHITCTKPRLTASKPMAWACHGPRPRPGYSQAVGPQSRAEAGVFGPSRAVHNTSACGLWLYLLNTHMLRSPRARTILGEPRHRGCEKCLIHPLNLDTIHRRTLVNIQAELSVHTYYLREACGM